ncbi:unnamed protein product [Brachionus calyciflorus]|uniref:G-protein coupled receptors family 1 profile domain-containing protein n=1 Tax=Brachionus calyciflorus TaxID=104777 RepID=A0A813RLC0_9BILA|nr:unnamed protein product [Brachionus calyciflorus]
MMSRIVSTTFSNSFSVNTLRTLSKNDITTVILNNKTHQNITDVLNSTGINELSNFQNLLLILFLFVLEFFTIFGNILVLLAIFVNFHLKSPTHYVMGSLAVADLLMGVVIFPISSIQLYFDRWLFGEKLCEFWLTTDVLCSTASIYLVLVISIDRYIGITRPLRYSLIMTKRRTYLIILSAWSISLFVSLAPQIGMKSLQIVNMQCEVNENMAYTLFSASFSFFIPLVIILIVYYRIYKEATAQSNFLKTGTKTSNDGSGAIITLRVHIGPTTTKRVPLTCTCKNDKNPTTKKNSAMKKEESENFSSYSLDKENNIETSKYLLNERIGNQIGSNKDPHSKIRKYSRNDDCKFCHLKPNASSLLKNNLTGSSGLLSSKIAKFKTEKKAAKTLGIVVGCFLICWFPFFITLPIRGFKLFEIPKSICTVFFWLGYCNSAMNPLIYGLSSREFRRAYNGILKCNLKYKSKMERKKIENFNFTSALK